MKKCKYCAMDIRDEAIKCRFCGEVLVSKEAFDRGVMEEQAALASEGKTLRQREENDLKGAITVAIFDKKFIPSDPDKDRYSDYIQFSLAISNNADKDIRACKAVLNFKDIFGDAIFDVGYKLEDGIRARAKKNSDVYIEYNQFEEGMKKLALATLDQIRLEWDVLMIIYSDGTSIEKK